MSDDFCVVDTEYGKVRGAKIISELNIPYWRFLGIPYAKPPVGNRRFQKASKAKPWEGVLDALQEPPPCAGKNSILKKFIGSDDCLYLNIYTKNLKPEKPQPVIVYIFGGGFSTGSSSLDFYSPDYLLMHDVVIVIFNYRLGPLGFLSLKDKSLNVPGNAGMKDQQMVLEFVRDNIQNFGGDPNNVTLSGHSSGGVCVGLHCLSESSKGLFQRAIMMASGPILNYTPQLNWAKRLAVKLGLEESVENEEEILHFLKLTDILKIAEAATSLVTPEELKKFGFFFPFAPSVEPYSSDSTFLSKEPIDLLETAWCKDIDMLVGGAADEGIFFRLMLKNSPMKLPYEIESKLSEVECKKATEKLKSFYLSSSDDDERSHEIFFGDTFVWNSIFRFLKARCNSKGKGKNFMHIFAVDSPTQNHYRNRNYGPGSKGVFHADELSYMWKNEEGDVPSRDSMEFRAIETFTSIITNFAKTGDPGIPDWKPIDELPPKALTILADELKFEVPAESERIFNFWEKIYEEAGVKFC